MIIWEYPLLIFAQVELPLLLATAVLYRLSLNYFTLKSRPEEMRIHSNPTSWINIHNFYWIQVRVYGFSLILMELIFLLYLKLHIFVIHDPRDENFSICQNLILGIAMSFGIVTPLFLAFQCAIHNKIFGKNSNRLIFVAMHLCILGMLGFALPPIVEYLKMSIGISSLSTSIVEFFPHLGAVAGAAFFLPVVYMFFFLTPAARAYMNGISKATFDKYNKILKTIDVHKEEQTLNKGVDLHLLIEVAKLTGNFEKAQILSTRMLNSIERG